MLVAFVSQRLAPAWKLDAGAHDVRDEVQILVGKGGSMIREIGTRARPEIEALLGRQVYLELVVKVRPHWRRNEATLERLGL